MSPFIVPGGSGRSFLDLQDDALGDDFGADKYRTSVKRWINDALADIARKVHLPGLEDVWTPTLVSGTSTYALPSDDVRILSAFDGDLHQSIDELMPADLDTAPTSSGRPSSFAQVGTSVVLYPTPDSAYSVSFRYLRTLTDLSADDSTAGPTIPDSYADMVVSFVRSRLFRKEDDKEMSDFWRAEYERDLQSLRSDIQRRSRSRVRQVPGPYRRPVRPRFSRP